MSSAEQPLNRKRDAAAMENNNENVHPIPKAPRRPKDHEPPIEDTGAKLTWRGNPTETYSDWKIEIVTKKTIECDQGKTLLFDEKGQNRNGDTHKDDESIDQNSKEDVNEPKGMSFKSGSHEVKGKKEGEAVEVKKEGVAPEIEINIQTYHVHRSVLAFGARKSDYFARVFQGSFQEAQSRTSRIELGKMAADVFPQFLDYLYQKDKETKICVEKITALHYLGEYFEVEQLRWDASQYIKKVISVENVATLHKHSRILCNSSILDLVSEFLVSNIVKVSATIHEPAFQETAHAIIKAPDQELWLDVLSRIDSQDKTTSKCASEIIGSYAWVHRKSLDSATFQKMTDPKVLPYIDHKSALLFACANGIICATESKDCKTLSSLQQRCATALADQYADVLNWAQTDNTTIQELTEQTPLFLVDLLIKSWTKAIAR